MSAIGGGREIMSNLYLLLSQSHAVARCFSIVPTYVMPLITAK